MMISCSSQSTDDVKKPSPKRSDLNFGDRFNSLPQEVIDRLFRDILTQKGDVKLFGCVRRLNKSFKFLAGWKEMPDRTIPIPLAMPLNPAHLIRAIRTGQLKAVKKLLSHSEVKDQLEDFPVDPLEAAIEADQTEIFKDLWKRQEIIKNEFRLFSLAIEKGRLEIIELLEKTIPCHPANCEELAVKSENLTILGKFLPSTHLCYLHSSHYHRLLLQAVRQFTPQTKQQNIATIRYLLSHVNLQDKHLWGRHAPNPLQEAIVRKDPDLCLILWNSKLFWPDPDLFHKACANGQHQLAAEFLKVPGFQVKDPKSNFQSAIQGKHPEVVRTLLRSPRVLATPLLRKTIELVKSIAMFILLWVGVGVLACVKACDAVLLSGVPFLIHLKQFAIVTGICIAATVAVGILIEIGYIFAHAVTLARPAAYLAYHDIKAYVSRH